MKSATLKRNRAGFTLIELVLTIIILGFSATILLPFFTAITHSPDPVLREKAVALAQAMMDEIMAKKWDENSPNGGGPIYSGESPAASSRPFTGIVTASGIGLDVSETRTTFDDVDDYNDINETNSFIDQNGEATAMDGFTRTVAVAYISSSANPIDDTTATAGGTTDSKRIMVSVTITPLGETFTLVAVSCNI